MRHRGQKTPQRKLPLAPPPRINPTVKEEAVSSLADLIAEVMRQPDAPGREWT